MLPGLVPQLTQVVINATANMDLHQNDPCWLVMDAPPQRGGLPGLRRIEHLRRTEAHGDVHCSFRVAREALCLLKDA